MIIPKIKIDGDKTFSVVENKLDALKSHRISNENWTQLINIPKVGFKIAHDSENLYLQYKVEEKEILAQAKGNNSKVWTDSCVEFFISFEGEEYYYNLEMTCIGQALMGYRKEKNNSVHAEDHILNSIKRLPSLGLENFELKKGDFEWSLLAVIPASAFWQSNIKSFDHMKAKANFYKCGDNLTNPHFLSWAPIELEKPNFHVPEFFADVFFE